MGNSESICIQLEAFGVQISLIGNYVLGQSITLIFDMKEEEKGSFQKDFSALSPDDQATLKSNIKDNQSLKDQLDSQYGEKDWDTVLIKLLHRIHIDNAALYWDTKSGNTLFFLSVYVDLHNSFSTADSGFALEFLSFDLLYSKDPISKKDKAKYQKEIFDLKRELKDAGSLQRQVNAASNALSAIQNQIKELQNTLTHNDQSLEELEKKLERNVKELDSVLNTFTKNQKEQEALSSSLSRRTETDTLSSLLSQRAKNMADVEETLAKPDKIIQTIIDRKDDIDHAPDIDKNSDAWKEILEEVDPQPNS